MGVTLEDITVDVGWIEKMPRGNNDDEGSVSVWMCVPVSSGMEAWSEWRSFLKVMFPNCSTADTTFNRPDEQTEQVTVSHSSQVDSQNVKPFILFYIRECHSVVQNKYNFIRVECIQIYE